MPAPPNNDAIRAAARGIEAALIRQMLRAMEKAQLENGLFGGSSAGKTRGTAFELMLSEALAENEPFGLAGQIEQQLAAGRVSEETLSSVEGSGGADSGASLPDWSDFFRWEPQEMPRAADE